MSVALLCPERPCSPKPDRSHPPEFHEASDDRATMAVVLQALRDLSSIPSIPAFPDRVLELVARAIPFDVGFYSEVESGAARCIVLTRPAPADLTVSAERFAACVAEDSVMRAALPVDGTARRSSDVLCRFDYCATPSYTEIYGPAGAEHLLAVSLESPPQVDVQLVLGRRDRDFAASERDLLQLLRPHLDQALGHLRRSDRLGRVLKVVAGGRPCVTVRIDALGEMTVLGGGGRACVQRWFPSGSLLHEDLHRWSDRQRLAYTARLRGAELTPVPEPRYAVRSLDVMLVANWRGSVVDGDLIDLEEVIVDGAELRALGLTAREAEVLALQMIGADAATIANRLGSRPATVKKQIENVYRKLGVHTRREAVTIALDAMIGAE